MSERIVPQLMVLIFISTSAVCGSDSTGLDEYKETLWTDSGLEMALDEFSHAVDCDLHYPNSSCSGVSTALYLYVCMGFIVFGSLF